jgi:hypothetical protein
LRGSDRLPCCASSSRGSGGGEAAWARDLEPIIEDPEADPAAEAEIAVNEGVGEGLSHGLFGVFEAELARPQEVGHSACVRADEGERLAEQGAKIALEIAAGGDRIGEALAGDPDGAEAPLRAVKLRQCPKGHEPSDRWLRAAADGDEQADAGGELFGAEARGEHGRALAEIGGEGVEIEVFKGGAGDGAALKPDRCGGDECHGEASVR